MTCSIFNKHQANLASAREGELLRQIRSVHYLLTKTRRARTKNRSGWIVVPEKDWQLLEAAIERLAKGIR